MSQSFHPDSRHSRRLQQFLDHKAAWYNRLDFIAEDPIAIPHAFSRLQDIEIAGFLTALLSWGRRSQILKSTRNLMERMDHAPYAFVCHHSKKDLLQLQGFVHRTFNDTDLLYLVSFLHHHYRKEASLEQAFSRFLHPNDLTVEAALIGFHDYCFEEDHPARTVKHIATPARHSACKRLNMFLRWMVRTDASGVDFGLWKQIRPSQLVCPMDVHVERVARRLGLLGSEGSAWKRALELTEALRIFDAHDPVKYDFALFGLGVMEHQRI